MTRPLSEDSENILRELAAGAEPGEGEVVMEEAHRMTPAEARHHAVAGMSYLEWMAAYLDARWHATYPPGACCSLDPADWDNVGREAVFMPVPDILLSDDTAGSGLDDLDRGGGW